MLRRRWTANLHRDFVHAVEALGGEQIATPTPILNYMIEREPNWRELTMLQVQSHLQMYRIKKREEREKEERVANSIMEMNRRETELHLRQYERLQQIANSIPNEEDNGANNNDDANDETSSLDSK